MVKRLKVLYRQKKDLYPLVIILGDLIAYREGIIYIETELIQITTEGRRIIIFFNILLLGKDEAVLGMP